jgi:tRNA-splicing ligase RtcB
VASEVKPKTKEVVAQLFRDVPTGVGSSRAIPKLDRHELKTVLRKGALWAAERGYGEAGDAERIEEGGRLSWADPERVSERALERGADQLGTLGSGNHFLELDEVAEVRLPEVAERFGLFEGQLCVLIHSGSRGLGYQVCDDHLELMQAAVRKYGIALPDAQLACAPVESEEGKAYLGAMAAAANFAWANRQTMQGLAERALLHAMRIGPADLRARLVYDVCHNIGKFEEHLVDGVPRRLFVHRKGATRAFAPGDARVPDAYRDVGQPVLIPGDMGRASYVLVGAPGAMRESWGSSCHGAGRRLSRHAALKAAKGRHIFKEMEAQGVVVMGKGHKSVAEEIPEAYKDVSEVVSVVERAGLSRIVARLRPFGVIKG